MPALSTHGLCIFDVEFPKLSLLGLDVIQPLSKCITIRLFRLKPFCNIFWVAFGDGDSNNTQLQTGGN